MIRPSGRIDLLSAGELGRNITETIEAGQAHIIVDLSAVPFVDSSGLAALVAGLKASRASGGDLRVACLDPQVQVIFELTRLDTVLPPYASVDAAADGWRA